MRSAVVGLALTALLGHGCVRRSLTIHTEPPGALVYLNDEEVGRSPVTTDFLWYDDYDIAIRKENFAALATHEKVRAPWYQVPPIDFWAEVLWPGRFHDQRSFSYILDPHELPNREELIQRAGELRDAAAALSE